jgi:hypothetical protein
MRFEWIFPVTVCVTCLRTNPPALKANPFIPLMYETEQNAKVNTQIYPCKHTEDGYCLRPENDYCHANECKGCDHKDTSIVVLEIVATCEKTAIQCDYCGEILTKPETDCR